MDRSPEFDSTRLVLTGVPRVVAPEAAACPARLAAVARYEVLDTPPDGAYDRVAALAARWFNAPIATVSIVDKDRIWFKATHGLDGVSQIGQSPGSAPPRSVTTART